MLFNILFSEFNANNLDIIQMLAIIRNIFFFKLISKHLRDQNFNADNHKDLDAHEKGFLIDIHEVIVNQVTKKTQMIQ